MGSSTKGGGDSGKGGSMYQDDSKVYGAIKLYTTLDDQNNDSGESKLDLGMMGKGSYNENIKGMSKKNILVRIEKVIMKRLFIVNHIILSN